MANTLMELLVSIGANTEGFEKGINEAEKSVKGFATDMQKIGKNMMKIGTSMTVGLTLPIVAFGASAVKSAMESENAIADLEAVLKSTGGVAGMTLTQLEDLAGGLQKVTKFSDESVMAAEGMLLTFTNIGKDIFPQATEATLDMAQKFGMDASQAAITLGKALNDPIAGVTALRRIGVMLTDQQEEQIKSFMAVGNIAGAQAIIMQELAVEIGGVARAAGETTSGKFAILNNELDTMKETIGAALIPTLLNLANAIMPMINGFTALSPATQNTIIAIAAIAAAIGPLTTVIGGVTSAIGFLMPVITALFTFISAVAIPAIGAFIIANAAWIVPLLIIIGVVALVYLAFKNNFMGITTTVQQLWFIIKWAFGNIMKSIGDLIAKLGALAASFLGIKSPNLGFGSPPPAGHKALGGSVLAGVPVTVGEHGMETFIPAVNGRVMPNGQGGGGKTQNITVNIQNPKREVADEDIRKALKSLSYLGVMQ